MGLTISVGEPALAFRQEGYDVFRTLTDALGVVLDRFGRPPHVEPHDIPEEAVLSTGYGYGAGLVIARLGGHLALYGSPPPPFDWSGSGDAGDDEAYRIFDGLSKDWRDATIEALMSPRPIPREPRFSQLFSKSSYYLPQDCSPLPLLHGEDRLDGGSIGSSVRLLAECEEILNHFDLPEGLDPDDDEAWMAETGAWRTYETEVICTARLAKACRVSIQYGALIIFD